VILAVATEGFLLRVTLPVTLSIVRSEVLPVSNEYLISSLWFNLLFTGFVPSIILTVLPTIVTLKGFPFS
jgi:hypothetical protein